MTEERYDGYGDIVAPPEAVPTAHADHIFGVRVGRAKDGSVAGIDLQYRVEGQPRSLTIDLRNAMFLLAILKSLQLNEGLPFPDDPRDPNWRAGDHK